MTKKLLTATAAALLCAASLMADDATSGIALRWVGNEPSVPTGQSWGVPFKKGEVSSEGIFTLKDSAGETLPLQQWVLARHRDGSVKWMGFAAAFSPDEASGLELSLLPKMSARKARAYALEAQQGGLSAVESGDSIVVDNGVERVVFGRSGSSLIRSIEMGGTLVATSGRLVCSLEDRSLEDRNILSYKDFESKIETVTLEKSGPVLAVVKVEGVHSNGVREWLPFTVRFYIYKGVAPIRMVHSIIYDGEQSEDFISGLGVEFTLPLREEIHNRHVSFAGENGGLWSEAAKPLSGRRVLRSPSSQNVLADQVAGKRTPNQSEVDPAGQKLIRDWADWSDYRLEQLTPDGFTIRKRTNAQSRWIGTAGGNRAEGYVQAGDLTGGLGVSLKNFWQSYPTELEVEGMTESEARLRVWMWSPRGEAMDMRHYDTEGHDLNSSYEDYQEGMSTPYGVARTSELTLVPYSALPTRQETVATSQTAQSVCQLMATPQYLHDAGAFGTWGLPDPDGGEVKNWIEEQINDYIDYYKQSIETSRWYGFWNYGDVMHSYAADRHTWNYDLGGNAWANTELEPDMWLWYAFVRTGREDIFRMASAMTRHTSEVDMYHIGEMAGLGTRHNVSHWGCGAKEARIGQAWWKRFYYYLTTDDRVGDLMHDAADADYTTLKFDPLRVAQPRSQYPTSQPTRLRWGPDWIAFVGNWFTEWERTGNEKYLRKIEAGMESLSHLPNGLFTGKGPYGYDPETGILTYEGDPEWITNSNHLANLQGGFEVMLEVYDGVGNKDFNDTYVEYASWYSVPKDDPIRDLPENAKYKNWWGHWNQDRLLAFAGNKLGDEYRMKLAWKRFLQGSVGENHKLRPQVPLTRIEGADALVPFDESPRIGTNGTAQWNLEAIIMLGLAGDCIPDLSEIDPPAPPRRGAPAAAPRGAAPAGWGAPNPAPAASPSGSPAGSPAHGAPNAGTPAPRN